MIMSVFELKGSKYASGGPGGDDYRGGEFTLKQGIVVAEVAHCGERPFRLSFAPSEEFQRSRNQEHRVIGPFARLPRVGRAAEWASNRIVPLGEWQTSETMGPLKTVAVTRVDVEGDNRITPGEYRLEVESQSEWRCRFIQPELGQSASPLEEVYLESENQPSTVVGPHISGGRPVLASIQHRGVGFFSAMAYSVDGTHHCVIHEGRGQFRVQDLQTAIRPGKEYLILVNSEGGWDFSFSEGY